jgi:hypothetical protein
MSTMCINKIIFSKPNTYLLLFLPILTYFQNCYMLYASFACIFIAMMSPERVFACLKGDKGNLIKLSDAMFIA